MKPDEYERARSVICRAFDVDYCEYCPLYSVDNCYEQTDEAEKILLKLFGVCPKGYEDEEAEKEECQSDAAEKHRADGIFKALRKVQAYCAGNGCGECAFYNSWKEECKFGSCPADWDLDDVGDFSEGTSTSGKGGSKP